MSIFKTQSLPIEALAEKGLVDLFNEASLGMDDVAAGRIKDARVALQALKQRLPQRPLPAGRLVDSAAASAAFNKKAGHD